MRVSRYASMNITSLASMAHQLVVELLVDLVMVSSVTLQLLLGQFLVERTLLLGHFPEVGVGRF